MNLWIKSLTLHPTTPHRKLSCAQANARPDTRGSSNEHERRSHGIASICRTLTRICGNTSSIAAVSRWRRDSGVLCHACCICMSPCLDHVQSWRQMHRNRLEQQILTECHMDQRISWTPVGYFVWFGIVLTLPCVSNISLLDLTRPLVFGASPLWKLAQRSCVL